MGLRETFEKLATEFAYEILAVMKAGRLDEVPGVGRRPRRSLRGHSPNRAVERAPITPAPRPRYANLNRIRIPAEKRQLRIDELPVSVRLYNALARHGYVVLGDLDGRTLGHLYQHRGFGQACLQDLRDVLLDLGIVPAARVPTKLQVPAFAMDYRLDELGLSQRSQRFAYRANFTVLGDLDEKAAPDLRGASPRVIGEFTSMIEAMTSAGPPESRGLLDHLDAGLDQLKERHRLVLLLRLGGSGEQPLTMEEIGRRINLTRERVRQVQGCALAKLPALAGPEFGAALRDLEARVSAEGADVAAELERNWRARVPEDGTRVSRPWANTDFYIRLLVRLAPGIEAAVFPPKVRRMWNPRAQNHVGLARTRTAPPRAP